MLLSSNIHDVIIIGAGSAGLTALKSVRKHTDNWLLIDKGPLGTTCARIGCMPSKVLLQVAHDFHHRHAFNKQGIHGELKVDIPKVLNYVRLKRDEFTNPIIKYTLDLDKKFILGHARLIDKHTISVEDVIYHAKNIIVATGASSFIPEPWQAISDRLLTVETFFEQKNLSQSIAVIGAGSIGLELGQALAYLGIDITIYQRSGFIGGIQDSKVNDVALKIFKHHLKIMLHKEVSLARSNQGIQVTSENTKQFFEQAIVSIGRKPNTSILSDANLYNTSRDKINPSTMQLNDSNIFIAGDATNQRALLHEAIDEGRFAGVHSISEKTQMCKRRVPLKIIFTHPNIVIVGKSYGALNLDECVIGEVNYESQGRANIMQANLGILRVYVDKVHKKLLGAEMIAPDGEHLGHLIALAIYNDMTVSEFLKMPFYHPVIEEGLRTALEDAEKKIKP